MNESTKHYVTVSIMNIAVTHWMKSILTMTCQGWYLSVDAILFITWNLCCLSICCKAVQSWADVNERHVQTTEWINKGSRKPTLQKDPFLKSSTYPNRHIHVKTTLKQRRTSTLKKHSILLKRINIEIWHCFNVEIWHCFNVMFRRWNDVGNVLFSRRWNQ